MPGERLEKDFEASSRSDHTKWFIYFIEVCLRGRIRWGIKGREIQAVVWWWTV